MICRKPVHEGVVWLGLQLLGQFLDADNAVFEKHLVPPLTRILASYRFERRQSGPIECLSGGAPLATADLLAPERHHVVEIYPFMQGNLFESCSLGRATVRRTAGASPLLFGLPASYSTCQRAAS